MKNLRQVSDLVNYKEVLSTVSNSVPMFLEEDGEVKYAVLAIEDFGRLHTETYILTQRDDG